MQKQKERLKKMTRYNMPDEQGRYGNFGGRFVPELLMPALLELESAYNEAKEDPKFQEELDTYLKQYVGRDTPLYEAENLSKHLGEKVRIFLKREDSNHTGAHTINNDIRKASHAKQKRQDKVRRLQVRCETPLGEDERHSKQLGEKVRIFLKREDLNHTGAHKINNAIGQALLAKRMGKNKIVAETGAGQHGVATATVCA